VTVFALHPERSEATDGRPLRASLEDMAGGTLDVAMAAVEGIAGAVVVEARDDIALCPMTVVARPIVELIFVRVVRRVAGHAPLVLQPEPGRDILTVRRVTGPTRRGHMRPLEDEGASVVVSHHVIRSRRPVDLVVTPIAQRSSRALGEHGIVDVDVAGQAVVCHRGGIVPSPGSGVEDQADVRVRRRPIVACRAERVCVRSLQREVGGSVVELALESVPVQPVPSGRRVARLTVRPHPPFVRITMARRTGVEAESAVPGSCNTGGAVAVVAFLTLDGTVAAGQRIAGAVMVDIMRIFPGSLIVAVCAPPVTELPVVRVVGGMAALTVGAEPEKGALEGGVLGLELADV
jgi:hypothetical protein